MRDRGGSVTLYVVRLQGNNYGYWQSPEKDCFEFQFILEKNGECSVHSLFSTLVSLFSILELLFKDRRVCNATNISKYGYASLISVDVERSFSAHQMVLSRIGAPSAKKCGDGAFLISFPSFSF